MTDAFTQSNIAPSHSEASWCRKENTADKQFLFYQKLWTASEAELTTVKGKLTTANMELTSVKESLATVEKSLSRSGSENSYWKQLACERREQLKDSRAFAEANVKALQGNLEEEKLKLRKAQRAKGDEWTASVNAAAVPAIEAAQQKAKNEVEEVKTQAKADITAALASAHSEYQQRLGAETQRFEAMLNSASDKISQLEREKGQQCTEGQPAILAAKLKVVTKKQPFINALQGSAKKNRRRRNLFMGLINVREQQMAKRLVHNNRSLILSQRQKIDVLKGDCFRLTSEKQELAKERDQLLAEAKSQAGLLAEKAALAAENERLEYENGKIIRGFDISCDRYNALEGEFDALQANFDTLNGTFLSLNDEFDDSKGDRFRLMAEKRDLSMDLDRVRAEMGKLSKSHDQRLGEKKELAKELEQLKAAMRAEKEADAKADSETEASKADQLEEERIGTMQGLRELYTSLKYPDVKLRVKALSRPENLTAKEYLSAVCTDVGKLSLKVRNADRLQGRFVAWLREAEDKAEAIHVSARNKDVSAEIMAFTEHVKKTAELMGKLQAAGKSLQVDSSSHDDISPPGSKRRRKDPPDSDVGKG